MGMKLCLVSITDTNFHGWWCYVNTLSANSIYQFQFFWYISFCMYIFQKVISVSHKFVLKCIVNIKSIAELQSRIHFIDTSLKIGRIWFVHCLWNRLYLKTYRSELGQVCEKCGVRALRASENDTETYEEIEVGTIVTVQENNELKTNETLREFCLTWKGKKIDKLDHFSNKEILKNAHAQFTLSAVRCHCTEQFSYVCASHHR
jgi:hypothetical protein